MTAADIPPLSSASSHRRKLLLGIPLGVAALQGCGGSAAAATVSASAPSTAAAAGATVVGSWAARPAAAGAAGQSIFVPDVGSRGSSWFSDGTAWLPLSNPLTLARRYSNAAMDASVGAHVDVLLDTLVVPAYVLGPNSGLRIMAAYSFPAGGTGADKAPQIRAWFGLGSYAANATDLVDTRGQFGAHLSVLLDVTLQNRAAMASNQTRPIDYTPGASINAFGTTAIDFTQDVTIGFGALNNSASTSAADKQVLEWFSVEMLA